VISRLYYPHQGAARIGNTSKHVILPKDNLAVPTCLCLSTPAFFKGSKVPVTILRSWHQSQSRHNSQPRHNSTSSQLNLVTTQPRHNSQHRYCDANVSSLWDSIGRGHYRESWYCHNMLLRSNPTPPQARYGRIGIFVSRNPFEHGGIYYVGCFGGLAGGRRWACSFGLDGRAEW
jgi:hypothetical protein